MGTANFGIPEKEVDFLKSTMSLYTLVEGGTFKGGTAKSMSQTFSKVITIEKSDVMYNMAKESLKNINNITQLKGDTRDHLPHILQENDDLLFWLDAHWSGGDTYGESDECPLVAELEIIFKYQKNYVILIDDARLFLAPPPLPHQWQKWPSLLDISRFVPEGWDLIIYDDVIYIYPLSISRDVKDFFQKMMNKQSAKKQNHLFTGLNFLRSIVKK